MFDAFVLGQAVVFFLALLFSLNVATRFVALLSPHANTIRIDGGKPRIGLRECSFAAFFWAVFLYLCLLPKGAL